MDRLNIDQTDIQISQIHLVRRTARACPSSSSTTRSDFGSYLELLVFHWPKQLQIQTDLNYCQETRVCEIYGMKRLNTINVRKIYIMECPMERFLLWSNVA